MNGARLLAASFCLLIAYATAAKAGESGALRFVVLGGTEGEGGNTAQVVAQALKLAPDLVAHAGGMVGCTQVARWRAFEETAAPLFELCPFYGCRGRGEPRALIVPRNGSPDPRTSGGNFFSFDFRGAHFVFLDTELPVEKDDRQTRWLAADLAAAEGRPIFVFTHRSVYGAAERFILASGRQWWHPLFVRHRARVVFSGARHLYHRLNKDGVAYVITGGGGGALDPVMARRQLAPGDVAASFNHCIEVTLSDDTIRCRAVDIEGRTRDEFVLRANGELGQLEP